MTTTGQADGAGDIEALATAVGLFSSAVKCGERWSEECQEVHRKAIEALQRLRPAARREEDVARALQNLADAEARYRADHDLYGAGSRMSGKSWDDMRRAGDKARAVLSLLPDATSTE